MRGDRDSRTSSDSVASSSNLGTIPAERASPSYSRSSRSPRSSPRLSPRSSPRPSPRTPPLKKLSSSPPPSPRASGFRFDGGLEDRWRYKASDDAHPKAAEYSLARIKAREAQQADDAFAAALALAERAAAEPEEQAQATHLEAVAKLGLAAEAGHREAQFRLATSISAGMAGKRDLAAAFAWYSRAAAQGCAKSSFCLGTALTHGMGCELDREAGHAHFVASAEQGHPAAIYEVHVRLGLGFGLGFGIQAYLR